MGIFDDFTGSSQKRDIKQAYAKSTEAARGGLDDSIRYGEEARSFFDPYAASGRRANAMYDAATGLLGRDAYQGVVDDFTGDPFREWNQDDAVRRIQRQFDARGDARGGNAMLAGARESMRRGSEDWNNWLNRIAGQQQVGLGATGSQAGITVGMGNNAFKAGQSQADREASFGNAMAASRSTLMNNLMGLGGMAVKAFTPGFGGATPFDNMTGQKPA